MLKTDGKRYRCTFSFKSYTEDIIVFNQNIMINYATSPAIGLDGTIYIGVNYQDRINKTGYSKLYAIN
jgi:hypothetical protein